MRLIDLYYKSFRQFKRLIENNSEAKRALRVIKHANLKDDSITITHYQAKIEEDWIENIEIGLQYVLKAINEERQFIRVEGEIVRIESVKKTSKESVEHLARHSNFITKKPPKGKNLIPDKLYITEKLNDYAVYENRFLLLLLTFLKDFIRQRLDKIREKLTTYYAQMSMQKNIKSNNRYTTYNLEFTDTYKNEPFLMEKYQNEDILKRLEIIYYQVESLLQTPLMKEVSKAPLINPPIVKTNVLRMNPNFRGAMTLYDYVMSYNKPGYEFTEVTKKYNPFLEQLSNNIAFSIELQTFITYKFGNDLQDILQEQFLKAEEIEKELLNKQKIDELERTKRRLRNSTIEVEEYILLLEKRNRELEHQNQELTTLKQQYKVLETNIEELTSTINEQETNLAKLNTELEELNKKHLTMISTHLQTLHDQELSHRNYINELTLKHQEEMALQKDFYESELSHLKVHYENEINKLKEGHELEINKLKEAHELEINKLKEEHLKMIEKLNKEISLVIVEKEEIEASVNLIKESHQVAITKLNETHLSQTDELNLKLEKITVEKNHLKGKYYASSSNETEEIFTTKERFRELEKIKRDFNKFFRQQWRLTKQNIKKELKEESRLILEEEQKKSKEKSA